MIGGSDRLANQDFKLGAAVNQEEEREVLKEDLGQTKETAQFAPAETKSDAKPLDPMTMSVGSNLLAMLNNRASIPSSTTES